ncbi:hypothetical protein [Endozoicomonas numazuensis]|uniref:hypothetical protein n=1 Tax=Endozoicomonas numazuensis TaxID=1137799 RepID=UPI001F1D7447|nr:hypothetical protein [Endozoicomonas numazuensis]
MSIAFRLLVLACFVSLPFSVWSAPASFSKAKREAVKIYVDQQLLLWQRHQGTGQEAGT